MGGLPDALRRAIACAASYVAASVYGVALLLGVALDALSRVFAPYAPYAPPLMVAGIAGHCAGVSLAAALHERTADYAVCAAMFVACAVGAVWAIVATDRAARDDSADSGDSGDSE